LKNISPSPNSLLLTGCGYLDIAAAGAFSFVSAQRGRAFADKQNFGEEV
jgi:hypothetical protein